MKRLRGFTLLELLIVLAVLGIVVGMASLTMGRDPQRQARKEAALFIELVQLSRERAVLEGREQGIRIGQQRFVLMNRNGERWQMAGAPHDTGFDLRLAIDGLPVAAGVQAGPPQLLASGSDEDVPFSVHFLSAGVRLATVSSDGLNEPYLEE